MGQPNQKESYQMQFGAATMEGLWLPEDELPGFHAQSLAFMQECRVLSEKLMVCFA